MKKPFTKIIGFIGKKKKAFIALAAAAGVLLLLAAPLKKVDIGYGGVLYNSLAKGTSEKSVSPGWHFVVPFIHELAVYPTNDITYKIYRDNKNWTNGIDASIVTPTLDNQKVSVDVTFVYALDQSRLTELYNRFNGESISAIETDYLDSIFKDAVVNAVARYSAYDVYSSKREEMQNLVKETVQNKLADMGITIKYVFIDTVRLSDETESIIKAMALAEAARIEAQGKSDANTLISDSLTDKIMTYEALSKLSDSLKLIVVPSGTDSQMDFSKILEQVLAQADSAAQANS